MEKIISHSKMKHIFYFFILCNLLIISNITLSQDYRWKFIASSSYGENIYYDVESIKFLDNYIEAWFKVTNYVDEDIDCVITKERYYCESREHLMIFGITYYKNNRIQEDEYPLGKGKKEIIPDSVGETIFNYFCK